MASQQRTQLNQNNRIYLYDLFRTKLGCGRQTFVTQVEEALASDGLDACSLGYEDTRALLEDLDAFVTLTVFKGGRLYATIEAQPEWDEVLDAANNGTGAGTGSAKPWKRKRGQRPLKPVRPRTVNVEEPEIEAVVEAEVEVENEPAEAAENDTEAAADAQATPESNAASEAESLEEIPSPERDSETPASSDNEKTADAGVDGAEDSASVPPSAPIEPAFTFTITFDPDNEDAGVTTLESTPVTEPVAPALVSDAGERVDMSGVAGTDSPVPPATKADASERAGAEPAAAEAVHPTAASPADPYPGIDLNAYPIDFSTEVWCPATLLYQLADLLPLGADALGIAGAWFGIACARGTAALGRNRATFPLPYLRDGERREAMVTLKRRASGDAGASWAIDKIEAE